MSDTIGSRNGNIRLRNMTTSGNNFDNVISSSSSNINNSNGISVETDVVNLTEFTTVNENLREEKIHFGENSYILTKYDGDVRVIQENIENGIITDRSEYFANGMIKKYSTFDANGNLASSAIYNEDGTLKSLEKYDMNGLLTKLEFNYDVNGNVISGSVNGKSIDIFGDYTKLNDQYGANQMTISRNATELLQDQNIMNILKETFPDATMEDYELYLNKMTNVGCGYVAHVNTLFKEYEGREQEFLNTFGFPMYNVDANGNIDFNYEYMIVDYMNSTWGKSGHSIEELYGNVTTGASDAAISGTTSGIMEGIHPTDTALFTSYLKNEYGITAAGSSSICVVYDEELEGVQKVILDIGNFFAGGTDYLKHYESNYGENDRVIIGTEGFDLYTYDENSGGRGELYGSDIGAHGMYVTGVTAAGDFIVSSWGEQYVLGLDNIKENHGYVTFQSIKY